MASVDLLLTVRTARHCYIVRRDQIIEIRMVSSADDLELPDPRGRSLVSYELGGLLDPRDLRSSHRRHALIVPTRRRGVALLVDRIEDVADMLSETIQPLASLLERRLARSWFLGAVVSDDTPVLVLDLRSIAQDVVMQRV